MIDDFNEQPKFLPQAATVQLTSAVHPMRTAREITYMPPGSTVAEIVEKTVPASFRSMVFVSINGLYVTREEWATATVREGDIVVMRAVPQGGNGGFGKILKTILMIALVVVAFYFAGPLAATLFGGAFGASTAGIALAGMLINVVGNLLINALIPPPKSQFGTSNSSDTQQYGVSGIQNAESPYGVMPRIYGRTLMSPPKGAHSYTTTSNDDTFQYLYCLFDLGPGPIAITDMKIGNTPITDFTNIAYETREGRATDAPLTIYTNAVTQVPLQNGLMESGSSVTNTTGLNVSDVSVDLTFPGGLYQVNGEGTISQTSVDFYIQVIDHNTGNIVHQATYTVKGSTTNALSNTFEIGAGAGGDAIPVSQYDVRVTRNTGSFGVGKGVSEAYWTAIRYYGPTTAPLLPQNHAKVAIKIQATEQLNGDIQNFNCVAQRYAQVWNGATWTEQLSTHPAWAFVDVLTGSSNARPIDTGRIDVGSLLAWAQTYPTAEFNYVFSTRTTIWQALKTVCAAGRGMPVVRDGLYSVMFDKTQDNPVQLFSARNISDFKVTRAFLDEVEGMEVRYVAETMGWQQHSIFVYAAGYNANNVNFNSMATLDLIGVTSDDWAFKLGTYFFNASVLRQNTYSFKTDLDHLACQPGDRVYIQHDVINNGLASGRITGLTRNGSGYLTQIQLDEQFAGDGSSPYTLFCRTGAGTLYSFATVIPTTPGNRVFNISSYADGGDPLAVGDLVVVTTTSSTVIDAIVKTITPEIDFKATVVCLDYDPQVHSGDVATSPPVVNGRIQQFIYTLPVSSVSIVTADFNENTGQQDATGSISPRIHVTWTPLNDGVPASEYNVRWKVSTDSAWSPMPNLPPNARDVFIPISYVSVGLTIQVQVRGNSSQEDNPSAWAEADVVLQDYFFKPDTPIDATVTAIPGGFKVDVQVSGSSNVAKYRLYGSTNVTDDFQDTDMLMESTNTPITVTGLDPNSVYVLYVTCVAATGVESLPLGPKTGEPLAIGMSGIDDDLDEYLAFLGAAQRAANDDITRLSDAVAQIGLGANVDFTNLVSGYTSAVTTLSNTVSQTIADVETMKSALIGYDGTATIADAIQSLETDVEQNGSDISATSTQLTALQSVLQGFIVTGSVQAAFTAQGQAITGLQTTMTQTAQSVTDNTTAITKITSSLGTYTGDNAVGSAIDTLTGNIVDIGGDITDTQSQITTVSASIGNVYSPSNTVANAVSGLSSVVQTLNGNYTATSTQVTALQATVNGFSATGSFRVTTQAAPGGADARIAIEVAANSSQSSSAYGAGIYLDAMTGGAATRVTVIAQSFYLTDGSNNSNPFYYTGGQLYLDSAHIQSLTANQIIGGTLNVGVIQAGTITYQHLAGGAATNIAWGANGSGDASCSINTLGYEVWIVAYMNLVSFVSYRLLRNGGSILPYDFTGGPGSSTITWVDQPLSGTQTYATDSYDPGVGSYTYRATIVCVELRR